MSQARISKENIEDYYPLSPMQEGMLLHTVYGDEPDLYVFQLSCSLRGSPDSALFEEAWQRVMQRHAVLRTCFLWEGLGKPIQVVKRTVRLPLTTLDWRGSEPREQRERIERFLNEDRHRGFSPSTAPLMRVTLIRTSDEIHHLVWTHHHLLLDGWSVARVLDDVQACYANLRRGTVANDEPSPPYRGYIRWLHQQDLSRAKVFWTNLLRGFKRPTALAMGQPVRPDAGEPQGYRRQSRMLPEVITSELYSLARRRRLTVNVLVQGAWALLLSRYANEDDVVFGAVVSGRPSELPGITSMVGLFINTLPVRVRLPSHLRVSDWLETLRMQEAEMLQHEYTPLIEVQSCADTPKGLPLFESILAFDNYPVYSSIKDYQWDLRIEDVRSVQRSNYPLAIVAMPGASLALMASYDPRRFEDIAIEQMLLRLESLLSSLPGRLDSTLGEIEVFSEKERALLNRPSAVTDLEDTFSF
ncbi:MAG: hypothetical protein DMF61_06920 [Blastocatellia bacterium AA13]|nr:MAG: hypothetical protein DMF61_06920 [Blastocatellia bacterium AA13]